MLHLLEKENQNQVQFSSMEPWLNRNKIGVNLMQVGFHVKHGNHVMNSCTKESVELGKGVVWVGD